MRFRHPIRWLPIRWKLLLLVFIAVLPALLVVWRSGIDAQHRAVAEAEAKALQVVLDLAARQEQISASTRQFLVTLSHLPAVRQANTKECTELFRRLLAANPIYSNILLADTKGRVLVASSPLPDDFTLQGMPHFHEVLAREDFAQGQHHLSRAVGLSVLPSGFPVYGPDGRLSGVLSAGVRMDNFDRVVNALAMPNGSTVFLADAKGTRLFNRHFPSPKPDLYPAGSPVTPAVRQVLQSARQGVPFYGKGIDGQQRLFILRSLRLAEGEPPYFHAGVSIPESQIVAVAQKVLATNLLALAGAGLLAAGAAWFFGGMIITGRIQRLAEVSRRFAKGDLTARTDLPPAEDELGQLAQSVDQIGEELSQREAERELHLRRLHLSQFALDRAGEEIYWADEDARLFYVNKRACQSLGYSEEELLGLTVFDVDSTLSRTDWPALLTLLTATGPSIIETTHRTKSGLLVPKEVSLNLLEHDGVRVCCGSAHDISERKRHEATLRSLVDETASVTGPAFFDTLTTQLTNLLGVHGAFVSELLDTPATRMRTLSFRIGGELLPAKELELPGTPCAITAVSGLHHVASGLKARYPGACCLLGLEAESYMAVMLTDASGKGIGIMGVLGSRPMPAGGHLHSTMRLFAIRASAELERLLTEREIRASLKEKEVLLKEIHHRVKNNLQIVSSLLSLQARNINDPVMLDLLAQSRARILSMALVHEDLYQSDNLAQVDFARYLKRLVDRMASTVSGATAVTFHMDLEPVPLTIDKAIPLGLLTNEMLTNAIKHAFTADEAGQVHVRLWQEDGETLQLRVQDSGKGLPPDFSPQTTVSLGMQLIVSLADQLDGTLSTGNDPGAVFTVRFPLA